MRRAGLSNRIAALAAAERGRLVPWLAVAMAAGVLAYDTLGHEPPAWAGPAAFVLAGAGAMLARALPAPRAAFLLLAAFGAGFAAIQTATLSAPPLAALPRRAAIVEARVRAVEALPGGRRVLLEEPSIDGAAPLARTLRIRLHRGDPMPIATGDTLRLRALLRAPPPPAYPGAWDLQRDAFFAGIGGYGYALGPAAVLAHGDPAGPARWLQRLREGIGARIRAALPGGEGAIAATLLTGAATAIPDADRAAFRDSGLAHLLAIAGLHIGLVMAFWFAAIRAGLAASEHAALHWPVKQIAAGAALAAGGAYMLLTGAHVPILRAFAMAALVTLGIMAGRRALSLRGLALAMAAVVVALPQEVSGVSFQMSFSAVLALIAGYEALRPALARLRGEGGIWRKTAHHGAMLALTSALAGTASAPFAAYHFGHIQLYFVLANMLAVPLAGLLVMPAGMLALLLMPLHLEALALAPMGWGITAILWVGRTVATWPAAVLAVPPMPGWGLAVLALGLAWLCIWRTRWRLAGLAAILAGLTSPLAAPPPDALVSPDARLIGFPGAGTLRLQALGGADRFVRDAWLAHLGATAIAPLPACPGACRIDTPHGHAWLLAEGAAPPCDGAPLLSAGPIRGACPGAAVIDRFSVLDDGATALWLTPAGPLILTDRTWRGDRPWIPSASRHPPPGPGLAVARSETPAD